MSADVEAILAEVGKAFRLCRLYPASHPSVQQAMASVGSLLPQLATTGVAELRITSTGFVYADHPVVARNPQVQELAGLLYAQGHRYVVLEPGVSAEEVAALLQIAGSSSGHKRPAAKAPAGAPALVHLKLSRTSRSPRRSGQAHAVPSAPREDVQLGRRSFTEFHPDALPPGIEARRLVVTMGRGGEPGALAAQRLGELVEGLVRLGDWASLTVLVRALGRAASGGEAAIAAAASRTIAASVGGSVLSGLLARLADAALPPDERDETALALAALGARAIGPVIDRFVVTDDDDERDILAAVVRRAGAVAVEPVLSRANPDARGEAACAWVRLLGATRSGLVTTLLARFAQHAEANVRKEAVSALAQLDDPEAHRLAAGALRDADAGVRATAALGIERYGEPSSAPVLMARLQEETDEGVVVAMLEALGELRDARAVPQLIESSRSVSGPFQRRAPRVRIAAMRALGAIGTAEALAVLEERLTSGTAEVREAAARILGK